MFFPPPRRANARASGASACESSYAAAATARPTLDQSRVWSRGESEVEPVTPKTRSRASKNSLFAKGLRTTSSKRFPRFLCKREAVMWSTGVFGEAALIFCASCSPVIRGMVPSVITASNDCVENIWNPISPSAASVTTYPCSRNALPNTLWIESSSSTSRMEYAEGLIKARQLAGVGIKNGRERKSGTTLSANLLKHTAYQ